MAIQDRHGIEALLVTLLVNSARLLTLTDLIQYRFVEVDAADLDLPRFASLLDTLYDSNGIEVGRCEDSVNVGVLKQVRAHGLSYSRDITLCCCRQRQRCG